MRVILPLFLLLLSLAVTHEMEAQETALFLRDSIRTDRGIVGTTDFEPESHTYFLNYDEQGRVLEQVRQRLDQKGDWVPQSRRTFVYEDDQLVETLIQLWSTNNNMWLDQRKDLYTYQNGLRTEYIRQRAPGGQLENERRWTYTYNEQDQETEVLLEQWNTGAWENLSRKQITYNEQEEIDRQLLQVWINGNWRDVRARDWEYEMVGNRSRVTMTTVLVWSPQQNDWVNQLRKIFNYNNDGLWISSRFETWQQATQTWINDDRMVYFYDDQNRPIGQVLQRWDDDWENRGRVEYSFADQQFTSRIQTWNQAAGAWRNFLRYEVNLDENNLLNTRIGMQGWNNNTMMWENRNFTERYTHYWSESIVNSVKEVANIDSCTIPNPYTPGHYFFCDLPATSNNYQMELYDMLGRPVYRYDFQSGQALAIDQRPAPGVYVLRIHDHRRLHHVERLVIH